MLKMNGKEATDLTEGNKKEIAKKKKNQVGKKK